MSMNLAHHEPPLTVVKPDKGQFDGSCNRACCQRPINGANYWNKGTRAYYCATCAHHLNTFNADYPDAPMCIEVSKPVE